MPPDAKQIIGIMLVKNDEFFVEPALLAIVDFCDRIIVLDNMSEDSTFSRLTAIAGLHPHIVLERIQDFRKSHRPLEHYAGTDSWVFGVDGDEIYDKQGLARLRPAILRGEFDSYFRIRGHMLHVTALDPERRRASGYATPPSRSVTKLYNFGALLSWSEPNTERLHGDNAVFKPGYGKDAVLAMQQATDWDACDFRCLHTCFVPRSGMDTGGVAARKNPSQNKTFWKRNISPHLNRAMTTLRLRKLVPYKQRHYQLGPIVERDISAFGIQAGGLENRLAG